MNTKMNSNEFWEEFMSTTWQQKPLLINSFSDIDVVQPQEEFQILIESLDTFINRKGARAESRIYRNGIPVFAKDCIERGYIPVKEDEDVDSYFSRLKRTEKNDEFCLNLDRAEITPALKEWAYEVLGNVYSRLGYIAPGSMMFFFYGGYNMTPFGVHIHDCGKECDATFILSLRGEKNIWTWSKGYDLEHQEIIGAKDISSFEDDATVLHATPGEAIYLPSFTPHVGESMLKDSFNIFLATKPASDCTITFFGYVLFHLDDYFSGQSLIEKRQILDVIGNKYSDSVSHIAHRDRKNNKYLFDPDNLQECVAEIPEILRESAKLIEPYFPAEFIDEICQKYWMSVLTSYGMIARSASREKDPILIHQSVQLLNYHSILWSRLGSDTLIAVVGEVIRKKEGPLQAISNLVEQLNAGKRVSVKTLIDEARGQLNTNDNEKYSTDYFLDILNSINSLGALRVSQDN